MDWLSLPRLTPGRTFTKSPHVSNGYPSGKNIWIELSPNQRIETLTLKDAQIRLDNKTLSEAFQTDPLLSHTKIFHWIDEKGFEYWLPVLEMLRKMFVRSPEMARTIIMYDGWYELVKEHSLHNDILSITLTDRPQIGDIPLLSLIASKPSLYNCWQSIASHLPKASEEGTAIDLTWPFDEPVSIQATGKKGDSYFWLQEILDVRGYSVPFKTIVPTHPNYIERKREGEPRYKNKHKGEEFTDTSELPSDESPSEELILDTPSSHTSRPKKYIHIQSTSLSDLDNIMITPEFTQKKEAPTVSSNISTPTKTTGRDLPEKRHGHLTDRASSQGSSTDSPPLGVGTKDIEVSLRWNGLECFVKALNHTKTLLGDEASLHWLKPGTTLVKPKDCGSRWFLKMNDDRDRAWCLACITFKGINFYFLEVGRDVKDNKFSLSTLILTDIGKATDPAKWVEKMIENNGHWDSKHFKSKDIKIKRLHHLCKTSDKWGAYLASVSSV